MHNSLFFFYVTLTTDTSTGLTIYNDKELYETKDTGESELPPTEY